jgi:NAD(P)-dependent dehydrogenase (short-subunit alcohol dehydrogenase family)
MYSRTDTDFQNKVVIITGASSGLGRQLAYDLGHQKAHLILGDKDLRGLAQVVEKLRVFSSSAEASAVDVAVAEQCSALVELALEKHGRLDYLVLCAGISMWAFFEDVPDPKLFQRLMEVNYLGAVYSIHAALPYLRKSRGTIVAVSSFQGEVAIPRHTGYSASKHALNGFLEALELELGGQIRILNVMPGWITGTNLRANAFKVESRSEGTAQAKGGLASVSLRDCSSQILRSMRSTSTTLFVPRKLRAALWLKALAPSLLRRLIRRAVASQE